MSIIPELIAEYEADLGSLGRFYDLNPSPSRHARFRRLFLDWQTRLSGIEDQGIDRFLFEHHLAYELRSLEHQDRRLRETLRWVPFAQIVFELEDERRALVAMDGRKVAGRLNDLAKQIEFAKAAEEVPSAYEAGRAVTLLQGVKKALRRWFEFYEGYDPLFSWWCAEPFATAVKRLDHFMAFLRVDRIKVAADDDRAIVGNPAGRDALVDDLAYEMIPYTPEELVAIGEREYAWCLDELKKASGELGFGDDWRAAMEHVKELHAEPGRQIDVVRDLALEAIDYLETNDLLTIPPIAKETWRMEMMSPEAQLTNPFFLGGESIIVSYPTNGMSHERKLMSMRGNNPHFSRATVQHELIPGHHMQFFALARHKQYREPFGTPFWIEGWALYWEMRLWDMAFPRGPEDRIGMLFWRTHRAARIIFSIKFHLGQMSADECIAMLVGGVGHEPSTAEGEVRRSFNGDYPPLYQAAYMIGGLQFRAMQRELVGSGRMTDRQFHDAILREGNIPVAVLRAILKDEPVDHAWRFDG